MKQGSAIISGLAGSITLTLFHQLLKKYISDAPRMDKLGRQALSKVLSAAGSEIPPADDLKKITLGGDIIGNAAYYSMVGIKPKYSLLTGIVIGLTAGIGAVVLPEKMGLNEQYSNATAKTQFLTVMLYLTGGLVAGATHKMLYKK